jgi:hypothetical protein
MSELRGLLVGTRLIVTPLYVDDSMLSRIVVGDHVGRWSSIRSMLDREGMPGARKSMGGLYYLPAQLRFLDVREGCVAKDINGYAEDGPANFRP